MASLVESIGGRLFDRYIQTPGLKTSTGLSAEINGKKKDGSSLYDSFITTLEEKIGRPLSKSEIIAQLAGSTAYALLAITHAEAQHIPGSVSGIIQNATERAANSKLLGKIALDDWSTPRGT